jgi:hypothetical protein
MITLMALITTTDFRPQILMITLMALITTTDFRPEMRERMSPRKNGFLFSGK